ncbi:MAG: class II fructose-bisphosphate aldolase family protein [Candidatus Yanofskybacteria bacterium]|nr:class II fructose-bisphosphate aldolase family protein [Candidatus Yanofskybacteria bacterium]
MDKNLNYYLEQARKNDYAIGHFNFSTADVLRGIVEAAKEAGAPAVMVGTSEGEADFIGLKEAVALIRILREEYSFPIFLNADHFKSFEKCKEAIDAGYDSVIIDMSKMQFADNVAETKKVVDYAKEISKYPPVPLAGRNIEISVEGELGYLRGFSEVQTKIEITSADFTKPEEAKKFVEKTGVNQLAVVFGNIHGIVTEQEEKLDIEHFKKIITAMPDVFYVLHGASGLSEDDIRAAIKAGITNVHFNTELRVAYTEGIHKTLHNKPAETTPYKYLAPAVEEVKNVVSQKIKVFMSK